MSETHHREVLETLSELLDVYPEYRIGQLIVNLTTIARGDEPGGIWNLENDELLAAAKQHLAAAQRRRVAV